MTPEALQLNRDGEASCARVFADRTTSAKGQLAARFQFDAEEFAYFEDIE